MQTGINIPEDVNKLVKDLDKNKLYRYLLIKFNPECDGLLIEDNE